MTKSTLDMGAAIVALKAGKGVTLKDGILTPMIRQLTEAAMQTELGQHIEDEGNSNRKNGSTPKIVKSSAVSFELIEPLRLSSKWPKSIKPT